MQYIQIPSTGSKITDRVGPVWPETTEDTAKWGPSLASFLLLKAIGAAARSADAAANVADKCAAAGFVPIDLSARLAVVPEVTEDAAAE
jgi:hypothetical protein